jgi:hypothetical protein
LKADTSQQLWRRADVSVLVKTILVGLVVGVIGRWMYVSAPPLSALANQPEQTATTPAATPVSAPEVKSADASPSDRR